MTALKFSETKQSIISQFSQDRPDANKTAFFILGAPGGGKSACGRQSLNELGFGTKYPLVEFVASLRDPVDVLGTPNNTGDFTKWVPPEEFYKLRQGVGKCALLLEELSDAPVPMQNALCGVIYDRRAGQLQLSDQLYIVATGNRTEDKSGANRITSKLAGRTRRIDFQENLDELIDYALDAGWPTWLIQYLRFKPDAVMDFDANRFANATPRTWEDVARMPENMPQHIELANIEGCVGAGRAAEVVGFKQIYMDLPDVAEILMSPAKAPVPDNLAARYAVMGAIARHASADNFENVCVYTDRFAPEFRVTCIKDAIKLAPAIKKSRAFQKWVSVNADVLI